MSHRFVSKTFKINMSDFKEVVDDPEIMQEYVRTHIYKDYVDFDTLKVLKNYIENVVIARSDKVMNTGILQRDEIIYLNSLSQIHRDSVEIIDEYMKAMTKTKSMSKSAYSQKTYTPKMDLQYVPTKTVLSWLNNKCILRVAQQRKWLSDKIKTLSKFKGDFRDREDFKKHGILPGQHLKYWGAFKASFSSHHFIYLDDGITAEVGPDEVPDCTVMTPGTFDEFGRMANLIPWVNKMNYFGLSNLNGVLHWTKLYEQYGANGIEIVSYAADDEKETIIKRLRNTLDLLGPWDYELFGTSGLESNNCENAANLISVGTRKSAQSCVFQRISKYVTRSASTYTDMDIKLSVPLPLCSSGDRVPKIFSKGGCPCHGNYKKGYDLSTYCNVSEKCVTGSKYGDGFVDYVDDTKPYRACKISESRVRKSDLWRDVGGAYSESPPRLSKSPTLSRSRRSRSQK